MNRSYSLKRFDPENVARSLYGAKKRANLGQVLLSIQTKEGVLLPDHLETLYNGQREPKFSFFEGYFVGVERQRLHMEVDRKADPYVDEISLPTMAMDYCEVNFEEARA